MIDGICGPISPISEPLAGALQRDISGQLIIFKEALDSCNLNGDRLTCDLKDFVNEFKTAFKEAPIIGTEPEIIQEVFIDKLKALLIDPLYPDALLEEDALVGTDGYTYNKKSLSLYLDTCLNRNRSPKFPENPASFWTASHPVVPIMVKWLKKKKFFPPNLSLEQDYNSLVARGNVPAIPTQFSERICLSREKLIKERLELEKEEKLNETLVELGILLDESLLNDELTTSIKTWHELFTKALETSHNIDRISADFITDLQELLVDPISMTVLDEEPLLGSDGYTYSKNSLLLYIDAAKEPYRHRSPKLINDEAEFSVTPLTQL